MPSTDDALRKRYSDTPAPQDMLLESLRAKAPIVLLLGQGAWGAADRPDPVLEVALSKLAQDASGQSWNQLLSTGTLPAEFYEWLAERFTRRPVPDWLTTVAQLPWSAIFTSSLDQTLQAAFSTPGREPQVVLTSTEIPLVIRSVTRPPLYYLFGRAGASEPKAMPPNGLAAMRSRRSLHVVPMLNRLIDVTTVVGLLVIEGVRVGKDWLADEILLTAIEQMPRGKVLWCGVRAKEYLPSDFAPLVESGHIVLSEERLPTLIARTEAEGRLGDVADLGGSDRADVVTFRTSAGHAQYSPTPDLRIRVESSATIVDDSWTAFQSPLTGEAEYSAFRHFHGDIEGPRAMVSGIRRTFAFERDFEARLFETVTRAIGSHARFPDPITVHGQSGTGKSVALARIVSRLRENQVAPVLYALNRVPAITDIELFCEQVEQLGAASTVVVCDNNAPLFRYRDLLTSVHSRGRRVVLVGSSYRQQETQESTDTLIEAPDRLSDAEVNRLESLIERFGGLKPNLGSRVDRSILVALYHALPATRRRLSLGLANEVRSTEDAIRVRASQPEPKPVGASYFAQQLLQAGIGLPEHTPIIQYIDEALRGIDDDAGRVITYVMVAGQLGCAVPIDVLIRALNGSDRQADFEAIGRIFSGLDLFRWRQGENAEDLLVGPRVSLEAEVI